MHTISKPRVAGAQQPWLLAPSPTRAHSDSLPCYGWVDGDEGIIVTTIQGFPSGCPSRGEMRFAANCRFAAKRALLARRAENGVIRNDEEPENDGYDDKRSK